jgi:ribose/xylose/arabinose/galactoside ABC-type transport system permease subunit
VQPFIVTLMGMYFARGSYIISLEAVPIETPRTNH